MQKIRNIAIIAHVDHGKTTLVDKMLYQGQAFQAHETPGELIMDNNDLERERGITILSKNVSIRYKDYKINIIDTPGHSDFGGEVERVLNLADGVLLLVDAFEGPMPQTRFVLQKAIALGLKPIVVINKVDKPNCRPDEINEAVFELMFSLDATEDQLDYPVFYGASKHGWMSTSWLEPKEDLTDLFEGILTHIPPPKIGTSGVTQLQITSLDFSSYTGRIAIGRLYSGTLRNNGPVALIKRDGSIKRSRIKELYLFEGLVKAKVESVEAGEICALVGLDDFEIGDTVSDADNPVAMSPISIDEPTMSMLFTINDSPFFGKEGKFVTSRHLKERLEKELQRNLAMRMEPTDSADSFIVYGRGILHLSILIETMRREGYELQVGQPRVIIKEIDGQRCEPVEDMNIDVPEEYAGRAIDQATRRKGELTKMEIKGDRALLEFNIPSRGIIGMRNELLTATAGEAVMAHRFRAFEPWKGEIIKRTVGSLISHETGTSIPYAIDKLQDRGHFFIDPGEDVYNGQVVGESTKAGDLVVNVIRTKKLTNMRASGSDVKMKIAPAVKLSLEEALEYISGDEYVEITPKNIRLRKIHLDENERKRYAAKYSN
ncbi:MAG: translational GTPase TypA [Bacteroidia bacterium]|nr:translational GTPase TypA [Bacteroidia bacterium]MBP6721805.1 translational GTPase TypA [Bacteroidia bacterium]MBP8073402.1 translational GTPase TypA [Bacteroidia bacterium]